jgi:hypothetical protein
MSTKRIQIVTDTGLPERTARISLKTWQAIKTKTKSGFFPEGNKILVGKNPFDPSYILFAVDDGLPDDLFVVSADVKQDVYPTTDYFEV